MITRNTFTKETVNAVCKAFKLTPAVLFKRDDAGRLACPERAALAMLYESALLSGFSLVAVGNFAGQAPIRILERVRKFYPAAHPTRAERAKRGRKARK